MLITTYFGSNHRITATTILRDELIKTSITRNFRYGALYNSDLAVEKLLAKIGGMGYNGDIEFVIASEETGYVYIMNNEDTLKTVVTLG